MAVLHMVLTWIVTTLFFQIECVTLVTKGCLMEPAPVLCLKELLSGLTFLHFETTVTHEADAVTMFALACAQAWAVAKGSQVCSS